MSLAISVSIIFFANKVLILIGKKNGWLLGAIAGLLAIFYFFLLKLQIYVVMEFGVFVLMFYGFIVKKEKNQKVELIINLFLVSMLGIFSYFVFTGILTIIEFSSSVSFLMGTYYLTHSKPQLGWILFILAHTGSTYLGFLKGEDFFGAFQVASIIVAIIGSIYPKLE